jgi:MoaA/NifB/PqqE/SkfB family radical SAM enzyme
LNTDATFRLLAWPRFDDLDDLAALVTTYASVFVNRHDVCLCLLRTSEDPPAKQAAESLQAVMDKVLGPDAFVNILWVDDEIGPQRWAEFGVLVQATAFLPSSATGSRARFLSGVGTTVVRDSGELAALFGQLPVTSNNPAKAQLPASILLPDKTLFAVDLCDPGPLKVLTLEFTSKCDLRCVYCPKSDQASDQVGGRDMDMSLDSVRKAAELSVALAPEMVVLDGTGETTTLPDWMERCRAFERNPKPVFNINTNLARILSDEEIAYLVDFDVIHVSIDTADATLLRAMRRKVNLQTIVYNIVRLRASAISQGRSGPKLVVHAVLTNRYVGHLLDLAHLCVALNVNALTLLDLYELTYSRQAGLSSVGSCSQEVLASFRAEVEAVKVILSENHLDFNMSPTLVTLLSDDQTVARSYSPGLTRICSQPWEHSFIAADEAVFPCCVSGEKVGQLDDFQRLGEPEGVRMFRKRLLVGDVPSPCVNCVNARWGDPGELRSLIAQKLLEAGRARSVERHAGHSLDEMPLSAQPAASWDDPADPGQDELQAIRASGLFDADWYRSQFRDVTPSSDLLEHYIRNGVALGYTPSLGFDQEWYLQTYQDVAAAGVNPLLHYVNWGRAEGRQPKRPSPEALTSELRREIRRLRDTNENLKSQIARNLPPRTAEYRLDPVRLIREAWWRVTR